MSDTLWRCAKGALFRFDPERVHHWALSAMRCRVTLGLTGGSPLTSEAEAALPRVLGMTFRSRVGLAAGFDKDAEVVAALPAFGFGFAEIGTVTPRPQPGNDRPRLFRAPEKRAIFNRMGFNGKGAEYAARQLAQARPGLPAHFRVGVNLGKNKDTPLERAADDYALAVSPFKGLADYLVINVSSPNTPGLRSLQTEEALAPIIGRVQDVIGNWEKRPPLLLKLAPELDETMLQALVPAIERRGIDGWVMTNTLSGTWNAGGKELAGGWSGAPLTELSRERLVQVRGLTKLPVISVGGIGDAEEAGRRISLGADLVQIYSGWIFGGPLLPRKIASALR